MDRDSYLEGIRGAWLGERYGAALFHGLAERTEDETMRDAWRTLARLEQVTGARMAQLLEQHGERAVADQPAELSEDILARYADSSDDGMLRLKELVTHAIERFDELLAIAPEDDVPTVQFLVDHELALLTFVDRELAGDRERSLADVHRLLEASS